MKVVNFKRNEFESFLEISLKDWKIDSSKILILGIKEGGVHLAEDVYDFLTFESGNEVDLKFIKCQRPSTSLKKKSNLRKQVLEFMFKISPVFVLDILRNIEHYFLTSKEIEFNREVILEDEIDFNKYDKILIVDDAVDSGVTLVEVSKFVEQSNTINSLIKSLAVVVTSNNSIINPDYYLYKDVLIRFPWSLDGKKGSI